jgi:hypothetical protein
VTAVLTPNPRDYGRRAPDHSRLRLPNVHRRLTPVFDPRSSEARRSLGSAGIGGPPIRAA